MSNPETTPADRIDVLTLQVADMAKRFGVPFRAAGQRAVSLGLVSREDWRALLDRSKTEANSNGTS